MRYELFERLQRIANAMDGMNAISISMSVQETDSASRFSLLELN